MASIVRLDDHQDQILNSKESTVRLVYRQQQELKCYFGSTVRLAFRMEQGFLVCSVATDVHVFGVVFSYSVFSPSL